MLILAKTDFFAFFFSSQGAQCRLTASSPSWAASHRSIPRVHFWWGSESPTTSSLCVTLPRQVFPFVHSVTQPHVLGPHMDLIPCQLCQLEKVFPCSRSTRRHSPELLEVKGERARFPLSMEGYYTTDGHRSEPQNLTRLKVGWSWRVSWHNTTVIFPVQEAACMVGGFIILGSARVPHVTVCSSWLSCFLVSRIKSVS